MDPSSGYGFWEIFRHIGGCLVREPFFRKKISNMNNISLRDERAKIRYTYADKNISESSGRRCFELSERVLDMLRVI